MSASQPLFEIHDSEINVEEIMARLRARIEERRAEARLQGLDYDHLLDAATAGNPEVRSRSDLYYDLQQLRENSESIWVSLDVRNRRLPLINPLAFRIEKLLHRLVVKYVNMLAGRQTAFNRIVANVTFDLGQMQDQSQARIESLEKELAELKEHLAALDPVPGRKD